jgi:hypothetical protein
MLPLNGHPPAGREWAGRRCVNPSHPLYSPLCENCYVDDLRAVDNSSSRLRQARLSTAAKAARDAAAQEG